MNKLTTKFAINASYILPLTSIQKISDELIFIVLSSKLILSLKILKDHIGLQHKLLSCISGIDFLTTRYRFCIAYDFLSIVYNNRIRIKTFVNEIETIPTITTIYPCANWWEREVWDMFGIFFEKHPDLRRILTDYGFEGFPLRKDFPVYGYIELRYEEVLKRIIAEPLELTQEFRLYDFETPW